MTAAEERQKHNAHRLAGVLHDLSEDESAVKRLAPILNYHAGQLAEDLQDLIKYIWALEEQPEENKDEF